MGLKRTGEFRQNAVWIALTSGQRSDLVTLAHIKEQ